MVERVKAAEIKRVIEFIRKEKKEVKLLLRKLDPKDFPFILGRLPKEEVLELILLLPDDVIKDFIAKLPLEVLLGILTSMDRGRLVRIASMLPADELSDLIGKLPIQHRRILLKELPAFKLEEVKPLLGYSPTTAGGLMTNRIPRFFENLRVEQVVNEYVARFKLEEYDTSNYVYAIDDKGRLTGAIDVKELLLTPRNKQLKEVVRPQLRVVRPDVDQEEVAKIMARYDLSELPVVDADNKLLGVVTLDDAVDVIINESSEDLIKFGGFTQKPIAPYLTAKTVELVKKRATWLTLLCLLEAITATVVSRFEFVISTMAALTFFLPLIIDTGGNSGSQASSFVIRSLAVGEVTLYDALKVLMKESLTSVGLGLMVSPLAFAVSLLVTRELLLSFIVAAAMILVVFIGGVIGSLLPILAAKLRIDPATVSSPLLTTIVDIVGLLTYFTLALLVLKL
ncbi:MAG: magnesium transporter [Candidatus Nezhaarchaeales archaeon]